MLAAGLCASATAPGPVVLEVCSSEESSWALGVPSSWWFGQFGHLQPSCWRRCVNAMIAHPGCKLLY